VEQARQDEPEAAKHLRHANESEEIPRQRDRASHGLDRNDQLEPARKQEQRSQQNLNNPEHYVLSHILIASTRWSNGRTSNRHEKIFGPGVDPGQADSTRQ
jgi:hypothetical protein